MLVSETKYCSVTQHTDNTPKTHTQTSETTEAPRVTRSSTPQPQQRSPTSQSPTDITVT